MEAVVIVGLLGLGYLLSDGGSGGTRGAVAPVEDVAAPRAGGDSGGRLQMTDNVLTASRRYGSAMTVTEVRAQEMIRAQRRETAAKYPTRSFVVDPRARQLQSSDGIVRSELAGIDMPRDQFQNPSAVQPFFGSRVKGMSVGGDNSPLMEKFTGQAGVANARQRTEVPAMFQPGENAVPYAAAGGGSGGLDLMQSTAVQERASGMVGRLMNNALPFQQETVGPGLGLGYTSRAGGGFHDLSTRDYMMPKGVDELRSGDPDRRKSAHEGRINPGASAVKNPPVLGAVAHNRPETGFVDSRGPSGGGAASQGSAQALRSDVAPLMRDTRLDSGGFRPGPAGPAEGMGGDYGGVSAYEGAQDWSRRLSPDARTAEGFAMLNASMSRARGPAGVDDLHRSAVRAPSTMRDGGRVDCPGYPGYPGAPSARTGAPSPAVPHGTPFRSGPETALRPGRQALTAERDRPGGIGSVSEPRGHSGAMLTGGAGQAPRPTLREATGSCPDGRMGAALSSGRFEGPVGVSGDAESQFSRRTVRQHACEDDDGGARNRRNERYGAAGGFAAPEAPGATLREVTEAVERPPAPGAPGGASRGGYEESMRAARDDMPATMRSFQEEAASYAGCPRVPNSGGTGYTTALENLAHSTASGNKVAGEFLYYGIPTSDAKSGADLTRMYTATLNQAKEQIAAGAARAPGGHGPGGKAAVSGAAMGAASCSRGGLSESGYLGGGGSSTLERGMPSVRLRLADEAADATASPTADRLDPATLAWLRTNPYVPGGGK